jgi:hypothetical protein
MGRRWCAATRRAQACDYAKWARTGVFTRREHGGMPFTANFVDQDSAPPSRGRVVASATDANGYSGEFSPSWVFHRMFADRFK